MDLHALASVLYHAAGVTRRRSYPGCEIYFRAAACTGALYEIELYLVCGPLRDLDAGLYHFNPAEFALGKLRSGDFRDVLARATANAQSVRHAQVTIICTGTYWRNSWKYQARTYLHFFWDNGTLLANLLAVAAGLRIPARLVMGFVDDDANRLLGLNTERDVSISLVTLGSGDELRPERKIPIEPLKYEAAPHSKKEVDYPLMRQTHAASNLMSEDEVKD